MIDEWVWITWHLRGAALDFETYLSYTNKRRAKIRAQVKLRIDQQNEQFED